VTAGTGCSWIATTSASWITITGGATGSGSGSVTYLVAANSSTTSQTGTITIAGQTFTVTQAGALCTYTLSSTGVSFSSTGGTGTINVTAGAGCSWTAISGATWIAITAGANGSGSGTVSYSVAANTGTSDRSGDLTVAGQTVTIIENAPLAPPTISSIANQTISINTTCGPLAFSVGQAGTSGAGLTVSGNSSNPTLLSNNNIVLNSNGTNWTVTITPATNQTGTVTVALTVCGGGLCTTMSFGVTVNALPSAPTAPPTITLSTTDSSSSYGAPATVNLQASLASNGHTITQVQFYNGSTLLGQVAASPYTFSWSSVAAGVYTLTAVAVYDSGNTVTSAPLNVTVSGLAAPWQTADVGNVGLSGSASLAAGVCTVQGAGDIGGSSDGFHFLYQALTGDGEIRAQISSVQSTGGAAYVGVMIRETLTAPSAFAAMGISPNGWIRWERRNATGSSYSATKAGSGAPPSVWVRIVRSGNNFSGYKSTDGVNWTPVSSTTVTMASNVYIGLAVASGNTSTVNTSVFSNVTVVP
jgi:hypothetical protein